MITRKMLQRQIGLLLSVLSALGGTLHYLSHVPHDFHEAVISLTSGDSVVCPAGNFPEIDLPDHCPYCSGQFNFNACMVQFSLPCRLKSTPEKIPAVQLINRYKFIPSADARAPPLS